MRFPLDTLTVVRSGPSRDLAEAVPLLRAVIASSSWQPNRAVRHEFELAEMGDPLDLPAGFPPGVLDPLFLYGDWSGAGATVSLDFESLAQLGDPAGWITPTPPDHPIPQPRWALSTRFDNGRPGAAVWEPFGRCRVWLPALEISRERRCLALNWVGDDQAPELRERLLTALDRWRAPDRAAAGALVGVDWRTGAGARTHWVEQVRAALGRIADPQAEPALSKIVLARRLDGVLREEVAPARLLDATPRGSAGWPWLLQHGQRAWLGESPELLGRRDGERLHTVALAGTSLRDPDPERDEDLGFELLISEKDRREQSAVADWVGARLRDLSGREPEIGKVELARLPRLQHLSQQLTVALPPRLVDADWLAALHPTPALCGAPRQDVRRWLREHEAFDRGLYGGVLGWLERSRAQMHVAIRGVMLEGRQVSAYAGAGLVRGSDPAQEWAETGAKLKAVCARLGLAPPAEGGGAP